MTLIGIHLNIDIASAIIEKHCEKKPLFLFQRLDIVNLEPVNVVAENYTFTLNADNCKGSVSTGQFTETFSLDQGSYNVIAYWDKDESNPAQLMAVRGNKLPLSIGHRLPYD